MWKKLRAIEAQTRNRSIAESLFCAPDRASDFSLCVDGILFDYSKTNIDDETRKTLVSLAEKAGVKERRDAMLRGDKINKTEGRAVLHTALRALEGGGEDGAIMVDGEDVIAQARLTYERLKTFARDLRSGDWPGKGRRITDVVNIGIGGSDLGPAMALRALGPYADGPRCHFVSNVDGADLRDTLHGLDPQTTLIIVASKTFTTLETMMNARGALAWLEQGCDAPMDQMVAISSAPDETDRFGIKRENVFGFGDYIGGRYSIWGPVGL
ncbi:MAG: glucose-6-phosphate isomerase, partial [Rhodobacteraceae bacterium]|nr:glucose-6-phosphate isomerase [Paracoccaceae bacterium]